MLDFIFYSFIYVLLFLLIWIFNKKYNADKFCIMSALALALFASLSYDVGWDYVVYRDMMKGQMDYSRIELLEQWLIEFCKKTETPQLFFFVNHFVIVFCNALAIKKSSINPYISFVLFLCLPLSYLIGISTIRAAVAASIMFFAYEYFLKEGKYIVFIGFGVISYFVHAASLIFLPMLLVYYIQVPKYINIASFVICLVFSSGQILDLSFLSAYSFFEGTIDRFDYYANNNDGVASKIPYIYYAINALNLLFYEKLSKASETNRQYIALINIGCCLSLIFSFNHTMCLRLSRFYYSWLVLLIPYYTLIFSKPIRVNISKGIIAVCFLLYMYQLSLPNYDGMDHTRVSTYWPYQLFFFAN